ncbi:glycosyltransferase family 4 protein [Tahibacter amnicola]|uniref:Glycosyltransferase family 4 protein n=1 Tax=Tahibacter amnicola TaxID=2976241 RepID=A0ABY6BB07_9GAMM|nr:glycosyltransferase family 4 protein [Tahibacter amnicola]UXI66335.1 glycosyltransferase family 4 protein [Tahibacter amnicola]
MASAGSSLRVLMLLEGHFPAVGGAERQLDTLARALRERGHRVRVVIPRLDPKTRPGPGRHGKLPLYRLAYPRWRVLGSLMLLVRLALVLWRWRHRYDAIHVHIAHNMGAVAAVLGRWLGKPVVVKFSGWWELERGCLRPRGGVGAWLARRMLRRASAVQAISQRFASELRRRGFAQDTIHWVPNGVDMSRFAGMARTDNRDGASTAVFVGRLVSEKGLDTLLRAWAQAGSSLAGWRLRLVGGGVQERELRQLADTLGIGGAVDFVGPSDAVEQHLAEADVGLLPSRFEGLSNTLLEYMAAGLPGIVSRISGSEDFIIARRSGWLFEPDDVAGLAAALAEMATAAREDRLAMGVAARQDVLARASIDAVVTRLLGLYAGAQGEP